LTSCGFEKLAINEGRDFYWEVPEEKRYAVNEAAPVVDEVGRLADDLEFMRPLSQNKDQAIALMLMHAAPLLRYLAYEIGR
jgi:hypothetical protein